MAPGRVVMERKVTVQIPAGHRHRTAHAGERPRRRRRAGRPAGRPLCAESVVEPHEIFERRDDDILYGVDLTMVAGCPGCHPHHPHPRRRRRSGLRSRDSAGRGQGAAGQGCARISTAMAAVDQEILVRVLVPHDLDEQQRQILQDFDDCCGAEHYGAPPRGRAPQTSQPVRQLMAGFASGAADPTVPIRVTIPERLAEVVRRDPHGPPAALSRRKRPCRLGDAADTDDGRSHFFPDRRGSARATRRGSTADFCRRYPAATRAGRSCGWWNRGGLAGLGGRVEGPLSAHRHRQGAHPAPLGTRLRKRPRRGSSTWSSIPGWALAPVFIPPPEATLQLLQTESE